MSLEHLVGRESEEEANKSTMMRYVKGIRRSNGKTPNSQSWSHWSGKMNKVALDYNRGTN